MRVEGRAAARVLVAQSFRRRLSCDRCEIRNRPPSGATVRIVGDLVVDVEQPVVVEQLGIVVVRVRVNVCK